MMDELAGVALVVILAAAGFYPLWMVVQVIIENGSYDG